ncbi:MAG: response regulator [Candidatus Gracilibacteria bacterium]|nr:response regulator [Candidatus Gracilibacteria bacterium]
MKKVLIIEDDKVLSEMYAIKLRKEGYEVKESINGLEGLTCMGEFNPDVVLLDIMMPTMNGFETLEAIKHQTSSHSKIIIFTNIVDKDKIDLAMKSGADDYLIKANTNPSDVIEKINILLKKKDVINEPVYIKPGLNTFKMKNPLNPDEDIEISINIKI